MQDGEQSEILRRLDKVEHLLGLLLQYAVVATTLYISWRASSAVAVIVSDYYKRPDLSHPAGGIVALFVLAVGWFGWRRSAIRSIGKR